MHYLGDGDGTAVSSQPHLDYTTLAVTTAQLYPSAQSRLHYLGDGDGTAVSSQLNLDYTTLAMATTQLYPASSIYTTLPWRWPRHSCIQSAQSRLLYLGDCDGTAVSSQLNLDYTTLAMMTARLYIASSI